MADADRAHDRPWLLLFGVWFIYASFGVVAASLAPLASVLIDDLDLTHGSLGAAMGAWQLVYIAAAVPAGILIDRIGTTTSIALGGLLIALSAGLRSLAVDGSTLIAAVMIFGLGGPIISAGAPKAIVEVFAGPNRGFAMGVYVTGPALGSIIALTLTNAILLPLFDGDWRILMRFWGAIVLLATVVWLIIARSRPRRTRQTTADERPLNYLASLRDTIKHPTVALVLVLGILVFMFNHGLNNWLPSILESHGFSPRTAGYWAAIPTAVGIVGSLVIPRLATPERRFIILIALAVAAVAASALFYSSASMPLLVALLLQGAVRSSMMTVLVLTLVELPEIGERKASLSTGLFFSAAEIGGMLGPLSLGLLYSPEAGFLHAFYALSAITAAILVGAILLRNSQSPAR